MLSTDFCIPQVLKRDKMGNKDSKPVKEKHEKQPTQLRLYKSTKDILPEIISVTNFNINTITLPASS